MAYVSTAPLCMKNTDRRTIRVTVYKQNVVVLHDSKNKKKYSRLQVHVQIFTQTKLRIK